MRAITRKARSVVVFQMVLLMCCSVIIGQQSNEANSEKNKVFSVPEVICAEWRADAHGQMSIVDWSSKGDHWVDFDFWQIHQVKSGKDWMDLDFWQEREVKSGKHWADFDPWLIRDDSIYVDRMNFK